MITIRDFVPGTQVIIKTKRDNIVYVVSGTAMDIVYFHPPERRGDISNRHYSKLDIVKQV